MNAQGSGTAVAPARSTSVETPMRVTTCALSARALLGAMEEEEDARRVAEDHGGQEHPGRKVRRRLEKERPVGGLEWKRYRGNPLGEH